jgi:DNA-binding MarR family transcriptional regulator
MPTLALVGEANKYWATIAGMTSGDDTTPVLLAAKPTWLLTQVSGHAHRLVADRLGEAGARGYQYRLLAALAESGPASQAALGRRAQMDRSDVTATVTELAADGLVVRAADAADRRRNMVTLTGEGRARLHRLDEVLGGVQDELLAPLSSRERAELAGLLGRVLAHHAS